MVLITKDAGMKIRADSLGVNVAFWTGPEKSNLSQTKHGIDVVNIHNILNPFTLCTKPISEKDLPILVKQVPTSGEKVRLKSGFEFEIKKLISAGGEGSIYETEVKGQVCKIYHPNKLSQHKQQKVELMVSRKVNRPGICWPSEIVMNKDGEFVGYLMPRASGITMQSAMFIKPQLEKNFPNWTRCDLVKIAIAFIEHIHYLHKLNIIVGDINPLNILIGGNGKTLYIVDTDSFQLEGFPCTVGTVNFTPPEIQGIAFASYLRTKEHELFAIATMIFMILFPGKPPYSQQGGGSQVENIISKHFPYKFYKKDSSDTTEISGKDAPKGTWRFIWFNLPFRVKEAFFNTFHEGKRVSIEDWRFALQDYLRLLKINKSSKEMYPLSIVCKDPTQCICAICSEPFIASKSFTEKLTAEGKPLWCPACHNEMDVKRLVKQSKVAGQSSGQQNNIFTKSSCRNNIIPNANANVGNQFYINRHKNLQTNQIANSSPINKNAANQLHNSKIVQTTNSSKMNVVRSMLGFIDKFLFK